MNNDLELSEQCGAAIRIARKLSHLLANMPHTEKDLFRALSDLEKHARNGQDRLNRIKPLPPLYLPSRGAVSG